MSARDLLVELRELGFVVRVSEDGLRVAGQQSRWVPTLRERVKTAKPELIALLDVEARVAASVVPVAAPGPDDLAAAVLRAGRVALALDGDTGEIALALPEGSVHRVSNAIPKLSALGRALETAEVIAHEAKGLLVTLMKKSGLLLTNIVDTRLMAQLLDGGRDEAVPLSALVERELGARDGNVHSVRHLLPLHLALLSKIERHGLLGALAIELDVLPVVARMECFGVRIDKTAWIEAVAQNRGDAEILRQEAEKQLGVDNLHHQPVVLAALRQRGIEVDATKKEDLVPYRAHHGVNELISFRPADTFASGAGRHVLEGLLASADGHVYPTLHQLGAVTGRMSTRTPNLQGLPRDPVIRRCIVPEPGCVFVVADYASIELRVAAEVIPEPVLKDVFARPGGDPHRRTAASFRGKPEEEVTEEERKGAKPVNFGRLYGMGARAMVKKGLREYGVTISLEDARLQIESFRVAYPAIASWQDKIRTEMPREIRTRSGRVRYFDRDGEGYGARLNFAIQGTVADGMKRAMVIVDELVAPLGGRIFLQVHDELVVQVPHERAVHALPLVVSGMKEGMQMFVLTVPIVVSAEIRASWSSASRIELGDPIRELRPVTRGTAWPRSQTLVDVDGRQEQSLLPWQSRTSLSTRRVLSKQRDRWIERELQQEWPGLLEARLDTAISE